MEQPKFTIGQKVKFVSDNDGEAGEVKTFAYDPAIGYTYTISARELDIPNKRVVDAIKTCKEDELVAVDDSVLPTDPVAPTQTVDVTDNVSNTVEEEVKQ